MQFRELTDDKQWDLIRSSLTRPAYTGRPRADDRMTLNGILYVLMSGCRGWMDMPSKYGSYKTVWERHKKKWSEKGILKNIMDSLVSYDYHQKGVINVNDLLVYTNILPVKKVRGCKRYNMITVMRRKSREARYTHRCHLILITYSSMDLVLGNEHESRS
jgi:transposase